jgi:predicted nucleotidyltransferase
LRHGRENDQYGPACAVLFVVSDGAERNKTAILKAAGCRAVYLFGSFVAERYGEQSDLDIAVEGLPKSLFFKTYGQLLSRLGREVDLVALDYDTEFAEILRELGPLKRVA